MNHSYFFDHNFSARIAKALEALGFDTLALADSMPPDTPDEEWLPLVTGRVVVSCDRNMKKHDIFQVLMAQNARTVVFLAKGWSHLKLEQQAGKIITCWWEVDRQVQRGKAYELQMNGKLVDAKL